MPNPQSENPIDQLREIRHLMERSSRFLSLSGLSGVAAGLSALIGAALAFVYLGLRPFDGDYTINKNWSYVMSWGIPPLKFLVADALFVLFLASVSSYYFTWRKAKNKGLPMWDATSRRVAFALAVPMVTGGLVSLLLLIRGYVSLVSPSMLIFYGLGLVSAAKFSWREVAILGIGQVLLGLIGIAAPGYGLELWALGFGVFHIVYGLVHYNKYDQ